MGIVASQNNSHRADERRPRIFMDWFYRIAHIHFKAPLLPRRRKVRGNPDLTLSDPPARPPCVHRIALYELRHLIFLEAGKSVPSGSQSISPSSTGPKRRWTAPLSSLSRTGLSKYASTPRANASAFVLESPNDVSRIIGTP